MGFVRDLTGKTAAKAAIAGSELQADAGAEASTLLDPFAALGQTGIDQSGFLTDPQAQFDFLQNNPLFQMGLDNANQQTNKFAAARGRLSAGDTLQQLNQNALLTASPLIAQQKQSIGDLIGIGQNTAGNQGNLLTGQAAALAAGKIGAANARGEGAANIFGAVTDLGAAAAPFLSDPKLKKNIVKVGSENGHNTYIWDWNDKANAIGLFGSDAGVMADEVKRIKPSAVTMNNGYMQVDYNMIGVKH
jgi:hypothetical protein